MSSDQSESDELDSIDDIEQYLASLPKRFYSILRWFVMFEAIFTACSVIVTPKFPFHIVYCLLPIAYSAYAMSNLDMETLGTQGLLHACASVASAYWFGTTYGSDTWQINLVISCIAATQVVTSSVCFDALVKVRKAREQMSALKGAEMVSPLVV